MDWSSMEITLYNKQSEEGSREPPEENNPSADYEVLPPRGSERGKKRRPLLKEQDAHKRGRKSFREEHVRGAKLLWGGWGVWGGGGGLVGAERVANKDL